MISTASLIFDKVNQRRGAEGGGSASGIAGETAEGEAFGNGEGGGCEVEFVAARRGHAAVEAWTRNLGKHCLGR